MTNATHVIFPRRNPQGVWVFTDSATGLIDEPFVGNINAIIDSMLPKGADTCTMYFSQTRLPDTTFTLHLIDAHPDGSFYTVQEFGHIKVGLCPALYK